VSADAEQFAKTLHPTKGGHMLKQINSEMGVIFDEIEIEEVIAPRL
jgi:hypothetical protein